MQPPRPNLGLARLRAMSGHDRVASMQVRSLWRYPVKSMQGEPCDELHFDSNGVRGDRSYGVLDLQSGTVISAKREGLLLEAEASLASGELTVKLPGGEELGPGDVLDENLTHWLGRSVKVVEAATFGTATFESPEDFERDDSDLVQWEGLRGSFVDESPLHLVSTGDLEQLALERPDLDWNVRRFRPNVLVETESDVLRRAVPGQRVRVGDVEIEIQKGCSRCVMTTRSQAGGVERQLDILRHIHRVHDDEVGVRAAVVGSGLVHVGDLVTLVS